MKMKILVVDDEALLVKGIRFNLQNEGYEVITGSDGLEAVQAVQTQHPDLVVLDVMMPNMDGVSATRAIRALARADAKTIPIIAMTANAFDEDAKACFEAGMNAHLAKPFQMEKVVAVIAQFCRKA